MSVIEIDKDELTAGIQIAKPTEMVKVCLPHK